MKKITIIDYGLGNLRSIRKALEKVGAKPVISSNPEEILDADGVILPGVGAFIDAMKNLQPLTDVIYEYVDTGKPLLGICLGQQILMSKSDEGGLTEGIDLVPGHVRRIPSSELKVPHMGWNSITINKSHPLLKGISDGDYVYFVHSFYVDTDEFHTLSSCDYGLSFAAVVVNEKGNVVGTQFHPEKSGKTGLKIVENFVNMC
ncbi:imidazole glycerol phosphate synthase, glutamine amidotransferase subunit [Methanohalobium evestigatum Z-7303]|uniref:Imidazole glycerol phosphate synthase subunit HisH n=1 Tax=Methanohalobium evestigatum (strain ATCC BAA-1072 / DSM 3721 / NBRC 107634 / OCM 161 / Z-7303) TaxID=644295 RepID=D7E5W4_METEZ|nr:imidazole glycerol phosphate synthase subunit HisH [Methanohalobium evestigatum]ADI72986.1 imidazole glycerol phosphate synthase, glutamine amidotransferase subunit [Methanohalobium evestigatum Z-7303]